jgi:hypothetical protein
MAHPDIQFERQFAEIDLPPELLAGLAERDETSFEVQVENKLASIGFQPGLISYLRVPVEEGLMDVVIGMMAKPDPGDRGKIRCIMARPSSNAQLNSVKLVKDYLINLDGCAGERVAYYGGEITRDGDNWQLSDYTPPFPYYDHASRVLTLWQGNDYEQNIAFFADYAFGNCPDQQFIAELGFIEAVYVETITDFGTRKHGQGTA